MRWFFSTFLINLLGCFRGWNLLWHLLAIALTAVIVLSGLDWRYFTFVRSPATWTISMPALLLGTGLPLALPLGLIVGGRANHDAKLALTGWAVGQAAIIAFLIVSMYKAFTGQCQPPGDVVIDTSRQWLFGFWRHGIFWGWPSGHTTVAFAMACTLVTLYPRSKSIRFVALLYAVYIAVSVSFHIHWLSEAVAGAIVGTLIGVSVGRSFRQVTVRPPQEDPARAIPELERN